MYLDSDDYNVCEVGATESESHLLAQLNMVIRVVTMHRDTWADDTRIVSRPKYRDTYQDATRGASRYVNAA